jgi:hypothetical protein
VAVLERSPFARVGFGARAITPTSKIKNRLRTSKPPRVTLGILALQSVRCRHLGERERRLAADQLATITLGDETSN